MSEYTARDAQDSIAQALTDFHKSNHESYAIRACLEEPCRSLSPEGMELIVEWSRK